jgi:hypothetical protein
VKAIAGDGQRYLVHERIGVKMQETMKATGSLGKLSEHVRVHPHGLTRDLHKGVIGRGVDSQEDGYAQHPFHAHRSCFDTRAVIGGTKQRDNPARREIDVANGLVRFVNYISEKQRLKSKVWKEVFPFLFRQGS